MTPQYAMNAVHPRRDRRPGASSVCGFVSRTIFLSFGLTLLIALLFGNVTRGFAAGAQIMGSLANFDVRYPNSLPNDLEIVLYGAGIKTNDITGFWRNGAWGLPTSVTGSVNTDPTSPAFGLDCVIVRYAGPPRPDLVGSLMHFGVRLRPGVVPAHQEVWWTINGQRILRPCDPHITWLCTATGWLVCVQNPNPFPIYIYGCRWFPVATNFPLPSLGQMTTAIQPTDFGAAAWAPLPPPGPNRVFCLQPWCRIYFRVVVVRWRPIIFQIAARNVPEAVLPLPAGTDGPNPNDWNGDQGTMAILTTRATQEFAEDLNNDGVVGGPDFNMFRSAFGAASDDRFAETAPPAIDFVSPTFGAEGTQLTITGNGFDPNPMNTCVFVGGLGARASVLSASSSFLVAQIGPVPQVQAGDVRVVTGTGVQLPLQTFTFGNATFTDESAISFMGALESRANLSFQLIAVSPNTVGAVLDPTAGSLNVTLTGNWTDGELIKIDLHLRTAAGWMEVVKNLRLHTIPPAGQLPAGTCASALAQIITIEYGGQGITATASGATIKVTKPGLLGGFGSISHGP